jgi:SAM-dependent methyltransferase
MASWNEGYVTDITYTSGFYREISPVWLTAAATLLGFRSPRIDQPYTYAELGCGQGFGTNLLAATNRSGRFFGFDFNPAQIANAQRLAADGGLANVEFHEASFQQLAAAADGAWPQFDFITLHGIYTWISRDNQEAILEFVRRFLKPGGLVYISYNCWPGWASMVPVRNLMRLHAQKHPARSDRQGMEALAYIQQLREGGANFFGVHNDVASRLERASKLDSHYLAHEYLNLDWNICDFAGMAEDCSRAKLDYLGSATLTENLDSMAASPKLQPMLAAETDPVMRQTILDFAINKGFRRDIFQKGLLPLTLHEQLAALRELALMLVNTALPDGGPIKFNTPLGEADGRAELYGPLLKAFAQQGSMTLEQIGNRPELAGVNVNSVVEVAVLLINAGHVHPQLKAAQADAARRFNRMICQAVLSGHNYAFLAAPALGSAITIGFVDAIALLLLTGNPNTGNPNISESAFAEAGWQMLEQHKRRLVKNGETVDNKEASLEELKALHATFKAGKTLQWKRLGLLP